MGPYYKGPYKGPQEGTLILVMWRPLLRLRAPRARGAAVVRGLPLWPLLHSFFRSVYASLSLSRARSLRALQKTSVRLLALKGQGAVVPHVGHPSTDTCASCRDTGDPSRESLVNTVTTTGSRRAAAASDLAEVVADAGDEAQALLNA